ncbi:MAG: DUF5666 domain-containing protein [Actinomycetota bacterium]
MPASHRAGGRAVALRVLPSPNQTLLGGWAAVEALLGTLFLAMSIPNKGAAMKPILRLGAVLGATVVAGAVAPGAMAQAPSAQPVARHFDGTVTSVAKQKKTFRMRTEGGRVLRLAVNARTRFERIAGFAGLTKGQVVEVTARRRGGRWVALEVERRRDSDRRGGGGGGGNDDGPNHT